MSTTPDLLMVGPSNMAANGFTYAQLMLYPVFKFSDQW
jgi:hypothetical protein